MKKRYVILITVAATLAIEGVLLRSWLVRDALLSWIEPGPEPSTCFVLTKDVILRDHRKPVGSLRAGQKLYYPCRHDLFLTEPFDPRVLKVYVEFDGGEDARNYVALWRDMPKDLAMRDRVYLTTKKEELGARLDHLSLDDCPLPKAVEVFRSEWSRALGGKPVPPIILMAYAIEARGKDGLRSVYTPTITCQLSDIPAAEFLELIEPMTCFHVQIAKDAILLREPGPGQVESWETSFVAVSTAGQRFLGLTPQTTREEITDRLKGWGIAFPGASFSARWVAAIQKIIITTLPHETGKLVGLLSLVDRGYQIRKPQGQSPARADPAESGASQP